jgi:hypothetical protein
VESLFIELLLNAPTKSSAQTFSPERGTVEERAHTLAYKLIEARIRYSGWGRLVPTREVKTRPRLDRPRAPLRPIPSNPAIAVRARSKELLGVTPSCVLLWCDFYRGGGDIGAEFRCAGGETLRVYWGRARIIGMPWLVMTGDSLRYRALQDSTLGDGTVPIQVGVEDWRVPKGHPLLIGSEAESLLIGIFTANAARSVPPGKQQWKMTRGEQLRVLLDALLKQRARFTSRREVR